MIFVTVGVTLPFERLILAMDDWARRHSQTEVFAQIGTGHYQPQYMKWTRMINSQNFARAMDDADLIVAHAGMGSVIAAREHAKPILIVPRYKADHEHATDHQLHTTEWLQSKTGIAVCWKEDNLDDQIEAALSLGKQQNKLASTAPQEFIEKVRQALLD